LTSSGESSGRDRLLRILFGFSALPLFSLLTPLVMLPLIARRANADEWAALAIGQGIGFAAASLITLGWSLVGPSQVARADLGERRSLYAQSVRQRIWMFTFVAPVASATAAYLAPDARAFAAVNCIAIAVNGLSPMWFNIGTARPRDAAAYDVLPRAASTAIASLAIVVGLPIVSYPVLLAAAGLCGFATFQYRWRRHGSSPSTSGRTLQRGTLVRGMLTEFFGTIYSAASAPIVGSASSVAETAIYASGDRLYRLSLYSVIGLGNTLQGWVSVPPGGEEPARRMRRALLVHATLGGAGCAALAIAAPTITELLFTERYAISPMCAVWFGVAFLCVSVNTSTGRHVLAPAGRSGVLLASTMAGFAIGVPAIALSASEWGAAGAAFGIATSQAFVLAAQAPSSLRIALGE